MNINTIGDNMANLWVLWSVQRSTQEFNAEAHRVAVAQKDQLMKAIYPDPNSPKAVGSANLDIMV